MTGSGRALMDDVSMRVLAAAEALAAGRPVLVLDDTDREDEADLVLAAALAMPETMGFLVRHTSGVLCVAMPAESLDRLGVPAMTAVNEDPKGTAYAVSVDARTGVGTGISASDRARTARVLADARSGPGDLTRPGHVFPLRAVAGGVLRRRGHTEAGVDLTRLAGVAAAAVIGELVDDRGQLVRGPRAREFAAEHDLPVLTVADLVAHRTRTEPGVERTTQCRLPTAYGELTAVGYRDLTTDAELVALVAGQVREGEGVLVRLHSECLTGDALGSTRCDCGPQLQASLEAVCRAGQGVVVYVRGHEGRGIGLLPKLAAYALQDAGMDTVEANLALGLPADAREYAAAAEVLTDLGVRSVRLLTNNPAKLSGLRAHGVEVRERVPLLAGATSENLGYRRTKRDRMGHLLGLELAGEPARRRGVR